MNGFGNDIVAINAALIWVSGMMFGGWLTGYLEFDPKAVKIGWAMLGIGMIRPILLVGPAGVGVLAGRLSAGLPEISRYCIVGVSVLAALWVSGIVLQMAQNAGRRFFGEPPRPIRLWAGHKPRHHRKARG